MSLAYLTHDGVTYFARDTATESAIAQLIMGLYEIDPEQARRHVRERIFTTRAPSVSDLGMIRVAAKRYSLVHTPDSLPNARLIEFPQTPLTPLPLPAPPPQSTHAEYLAFAARLATTQPHGLEIGALLVAQDGTVLSWGVNQGTLNRTQHAELRAIRAWRATNPKIKLPPGTRLYATLKPCRMCAGAFWDAAHDPYAYYSEHDPGPAACRTVLDAHSPDRREAGAPLAPQLEELITRQL